MKIDVKFQNNKEAYVNALNAQLKKALTQVALQAQKFAREECPVDYGTLRSSISFDVDETRKEAIIGSNVEYAPYVEFGTGIYSKEGNGRKTAWRYEDAAGEWHTTNGMKPQPYLAPAIENHIEEYEQIVKNELEA